VKINPVNLPRDEEFTQFFKALKQARFDENGKNLIINCSAVICKRLGFEKSESASSCKLYVRDEYVRLADQILSDFKRGTKFNSDRIIVTGTAGIGKSMFRLYLIWRWMNDDPEMIFKDARFNLGFVRYLVTKDGESRMVDSGGLGMDGSESLAVLDPCPELLDTKNKIYKLLVVTTSPSPLAGQANKADLGELMKIAIVHVMPLWSLPELQDVFTSISKRQIRSLTSRKNGERYGVPRWFLFDEYQYNALVHAACIHTHIEAIRESLFTPFNQCSKNTGLPLRLLVIESDQHGGWCATKFISDSIGARLLKMCSISSELHGEKFLSVIDNPISGGLLGQVFQNWVRECLEKGESFVCQWPAGNLTISYQKSERINLDNRVKVGRPTKQTGKIVKVTRTRAAPLGPTRKERIMKALKPGSIVWPNSGCFASIDAFGVTTDEKYLVMMQVVKGTTHKEAKWAHIREIVGCAGDMFHGITSILVYVCPSTESFVVPTCADVVEAKVGVCAGSFKRSFLGEFGAADIDKMIEAGESAGDMSESVDDNSDMDDSVDGRDPGP
jgi:hypothetical protein